MPGRHDASRGGDAARREHADMGRTLVAIAVAAALLAGCGRGPSTVAVDSPGIPGSPASTAAGAAPSASTPTLTPAPTLTPTPASTPTPKPVPAVGAATTQAQAVDLAPVDELLASLDRALAEADPGVEDDPSR